MKKIVLAFIAFAALAVSCAKTEIGGTAVQALSGEWIVYVDAADADGNVFEKDVYGAGPTNIYTYNTVTNASDSLWIDDLGSFWEYKVKVAANTASLTFSNENGHDVYNDIDVAITNGKIVLNGTESPSGQKVDEISFYVLFEDDDYANGVYYDRLYVHGFRYTGFAADEL